MQNKNLLIIYKDSKIPDLTKLETLFDVIIISKFEKKIDFKKYKKQGNLLASRYNEIIFSNESKNIFFICSSELKKSINNLLRFNLENDFSYFTDKNTSNFIEFLSGFVVKREILIKIGCFDRYTFHNLHLNFLVNYSRFCHKKNFNFPDIKMRLNDYARFLFWSYLENISYSQQPLQEKYYSYLNKIFSQTNPINRMMNYAIPKFMNNFYSKINNFVYHNTYIEYW